MLCLWFVTYNLVYRKEEKRLIGCLVGSFIFFFVFEFAFALVSNVSKVFRADVNKGTHKIYPKKGDF